MKQIKRKKYGHYLFKTNYRKVAMTDNNIDNHSTTGSRL